MSSNQKKVLLGLLLTIFIIAAYSFGPYLYIQYRYVLSKSVDVADNNGDPFLEKQIALQKMADYNFAVYIPKTNSLTSIVENVDSYNEFEYNEALKKGVAHSEGSSLPGDGGNTFLFSHSSVSLNDYSKYDKTFYLLNRLEAGDKVFIKYEDEVYEYAVNGKNIVSEDEVGYLSPDSGRNTLTMMTCWPLGTSFRRLIITGELTNEN